MNCNLCYRKCNVDRSKVTGYCRIDNHTYISTIFRHYGEEPVIGGGMGVCNVFFDYCNLRCQFCQNFQISCNDIKLRKDIITVEQAYNKISEILDKGCNTVGLVSPTPYVPFIIELIDLLHQNNKYPYIVYNTNGYDTIETIKELNGIVDIYLPDYKYGSYEVAKQLSDAEDYPDKAIKAIKEMYNQKGAELQFDDDNVLSSGLIIRHLVLPGRTENSKSALLNITTDISSKVYISLMSQYNPLYNASKFKDLNRKITEKEYAEVVNFMYNIGLNNGWVQEHESAEYYNPDFTAKEVFIN